MGDMLEVLFFCNANESQLFCSAYDFRTGTNLMSYKGGGIAAEHSLSILQSNYVMAANSHKPLLHVWPINAQEQIGAVRFVLPARSNALTLSPDSCYLIAGIQETIYVWHIPTGRLLNTIAKHYQPISCLRFTDDCSHFISAGHDGNVFVWNLTQVVARCDDNQTPLYSFSDHGLPVTDVHIGAAGLRAHMFTVSLDRTCKIYDLYTGKLLLNVVFAEALQCVIADALETCVYVGSREGNIFEVRVDSVPRTKEYHAEKDHINEFLGHKAGSAVNCLALSIDGQTLVSGGQDQQICIWHIPTKQLLKTMQQKGAVTNLILRFTNSAVFNPEHKQPRVFGGNLQRMIDPPDADDEQVIEVLITEENVEHLHEEELKRKQVRVVKNMPTSSSVSADTPGGNAPSQIEELRAEVEHLKRVNKKLFEVSVKHLLYSKDK